MIPDSISGNNAGSGKDGSQGCPKNMKHFHAATAMSAFCAIAALLTGALPLTAAQLKGTVTDPARRPVSGAQVAAVNEAGVITRQLTDDAGQFDFYVSPLYETFTLRVAAQGFATVNVAAGTGVIQLALAPQADSIQVVGSAIDTPAEMQGSSVSIVGSAEIRQRNEASAVDLLRELPGLVVSQNGGRGTVASLFVRGADSRYNLVELNGIPIGSFYYGGLFDFSQVPADFISEIQVARGPQSAVNGSYAAGSVVNFVTRSPENGPALDLLAEGGTHAENRFAASGSGMARGWGAAASLSSLLANGAVLNSDTRADNVFLSLQHRWYTQNLFLFGDFNSNDTGEPGPWGSNPKSLFSGLDLVSRSKNNTSVYGLHYQNGLTDTLRFDLYGGAFLNNSSYVSPYGTSFNKDLRLYGEPRATYRINRWWTAAAGFAFDREEMRNSFVTSNAKTFLLRRDTEGVYVENRFALGNKLFVNAGVREEIFRTPYVPAEPTGFQPRPAFPAHTDTKTNPKISGAYQLDAVTRVHASYGSGIRPPGGSDLAFTDNPALSPERIVGYDAGVERRFFGNRASLDAVWFHSRYQDLIVGLGGSLAKLSRFYTDNLANARSEGVELTARVRPSAAVLLVGNYTWLETEVLSLNGGSGLVQQYYYAGQPFVRRPKQSGSVLASLQRGRADLTVAGYLRGRSLDVEPNYGAFGGLYWNPGYASFSFNMNYRVRGNLTAYANLRNAFNQRYEEIYGFPAPLLNLVAGVKWSLARGR